MLVGIIGAILWELREKEPVVDLRMLKDRNFAIATMAMFFLGFVLYSSTVLIPQLLQQLLGYTAAVGRQGAFAGRRGDHVHDAGGRVYWCPGWIRAS